MTHILEVSYDVVSGDRLDADFLRWAAPRKEHQGQILATELLRATVSPIFRDPPKSSSFQYCEIGDVDDFGQMSPMLLEEKRERDDPDRRKQEERLWSKIRKGDWAEHIRPAVLVPKTRPNLGKFVLVTGKENILYTKAFIEVTPGSLIKNKITSGTVSKGLLGAAVIFLALRGPLRPWLASLARWGKAYPVLAPQDLENAVIPKQLVTKALGSKNLKAAQKLSTALIGRLKFDGAIRELLDSAEASISRRQSDL